jgi:outer membrane protein assembly factor BamD
VVSTPDRVGYFHYWFAASREPEFNRKERVMSRRREWPLIAVTGVILLAGCGLRRHAVDTPIVTNSKQPDKELYDRAVSDLEHSKFGVARLTLQTLLNTYPDSEYVARAKLGIAESWYRQGGTSNLLQAESEYKDFITFFPTMAESAEAQMRVAMIHYREMEKSDRDSTNAKRAEQEFQKLLLNYGGSQFASLAVQRLREVQEVLAQGGFEVARFYYLQKTADRAVQPRLKDLIDRYPNFSATDEALFMMAKSIERTPVKDGAKASDYYTRIVRDYPLSPRVDESKKRLEALSMPIPQPDPVAVARMTYEQSHREQDGLKDRMMGAFKRQPSVAAAKGKLGSPTMTAQGAAQGDGSSAGLLPAQRPGTGQNSISMENITETPSTGK